jgi:CRISPR/Cas system CMR-associated protein Cmr1 (group 7 of RAMP superfamily)
MSIHQYLKDNQLGNGLEKEKLQLRIAQHSNQRFGNPKVLNDAMVKMPESAEFYTYMLHMEGEEVFGSQKRKSNMLLEDKQESHRPNRVKLYSSSSKNKVLSSLNCWLFFD